MVLLPIFVYFFSKIGLINKNFLRTYRKHAFPILLLYELSINISYNDKI